MASAGSLKRPYSGNDDTEIATVDASSSLGGNEDVSEESLSKLHKEVTEMAEKVADYREKGPVAYTHLLEKSLSQMRSHVNNTLTNAAPEIEDDKEVQAHRKKLLERLASAKESLPIILRDVKGWQERLEKAMTARRQSPAKDLSTDPVADGDATALSLPDKQRSPRSRP